MRIAKEPLFHFVIGALLIFAYFEIVPQPNEQGSDAQNIVLDQTDVQRLKESWLKSWRKPPTEQQLDGLIDNAIKDEIYYREGIRLGLDQNDAVVRNRMIQKMRFLNSEQLSEPSEDDLLALLKQNTDKYQTEALYSFRQIYLGRDITFSQAQKMAIQLEQGKLDQAKINKTLNLPNVLSDASHTQIRRQFGDRFAQALSSLSVSKPDLTHTTESQTEQTWGGPIESGFGLHLIKISNVVNAQAGTLDDPSIRQRVENDWRAKQGDALEERAIAELRKNYTISVTK